MTLRPREASQMSKVSQTCNKIKREKPFEEKTVKTSQTTTKIQEKQTRKHRDRDEKRYKTPLDASMLSSIYGGEESHSQRP